MTTFNDNESGASVRAKINAAISTVDGLGTGDDLLMTGAERSKLAAIPKMVPLTQAEYDALVPEAETVYLITDMV